MEINFEPTRSFCYQFAHYTVFPRSWRQINTLKTWGKWRENVPGVEWFNTTLPEIEAIIGFLKAKN